MVRIEVSHQGFDGVEALELALAGLAHGRDGFIVGDQGLKGQRLITGYTGQQEPEGIGHGEAHRRQDGGRFVLDVLVDASPDNSIGRHVPPLGYIVAHAPQPRQAFREKRGKDPLHLVIPFHLVATIGMHQNVGTVAIKTAEDYPCFVKSAFRDLLVYDQETI